MLAKVDQIEIVGSFQETTSAFSYLVNHDVDMIFLDISMPGENGLAFAIRLRENDNLTKLVFVTSYKEYEPNAFEVHAKGVTRNTGKYFVDSSLTQGISINIVPEQTVNGRQNVYNRRNIENRENIYRCIAIL